MRSNRASVIALAILIAALTFAFHWSDTRDGILYDDSADYMRAAQASLSSTWLNTNSSAPWEMSRMRKDPEFRAHPWDSLYAQGDNAALRHFHGPVSFYAMHLARALSHDDSGVRVLASLAGSLICAMIVVALVEFGVPWPLASLLALFAGLQSRFVEVCVDPTPHVWYILVSLVFLFLFARFLVLRKDLDLYLTAVSLAFGLATLEFSVELFGTIVVSVASLFLFRRETFAHWLAWKRPILIAIAVFLGTTFVLWPGGWLRGGYLVNYGVLSATVLLKNKAAFGEHLTPGLVYRMVYLHHPLLLVMTAFWLCVGIFLLVQRKLSIASIVFSVYTAMAMLLGIADHFKLNTYISEFTIFLIATSGLIAYDAAKQLQTRSLVRGCAYVCSAVLLLAGANEWTHRHDDWATRPWLAQVFDGIRNDVPAGSTLLVSSDKEALALYLPEYRFQSTVSPSSAEARSEQRGGQARFGVFDSSLPLPAGAHALAHVPTTASHEYVLWTLN